ncbi:hypothetical protein ACRPH4_22695 (plasmid) [Pantoea allii]|uniref:hypothetical protein n=1 Tax=Pantoea allii TaxID=574096 RepID=UPI003D78BE08
MKYRLVQRRNQDYRQYVVNVHSDAFLPDKLPGERMADNATAITGGGKRSVNGESCKKGLWQLKKSRQHAQMPAKRYSRNSLRMRQGSHCLLSSRISGALILMFFVSSGAVCSVPGADTVMIFNEEAMKAIANAGQQ